MIKIKNLHKSFANVKVLSNINLEVGKDEVLALIGFSGSGKSTLLKLIAGLEYYDQGEIKLKSDKLGMCFQYSALFDSMTVKENIAFALRETKQDYSRNDIDRMVSKKLSLVGLAGTEDLYPSQLSGGMKKRVAFARAVINDPEIILYDEPTAGLDPVASTIIEDLIIELQKETKASSIVVTHQESTIKRTANKVAMLYNQSIVWEGSSKELYDVNYKEAHATQFREGSREGPMLVKI